MGLETDASFNVPCRSLCTVHKACPCTGRYANDNDLFQRNGLSCPSAHGAYQKLRIIEYARVTIMFDHCDILK